MAFSTSTSSVSSDINVTPLIDVLLVLLIIFMVIVPTRPRGLDSSIPQGKSPSVPTLGPVVVTVAAGRTPASPTYRVDDHAVTLAELSPALTAAFATRNQPTLYIRADRDLTYQNVAEVVSRSRTAGASAIALGTTDSTRH